MPERMSIPAMARLDGRGYITEMKSRLRDDAAWEELLDPILVERTRWGLTRLIESIDEQRERALREDTADPKWLHSISTLQGLARTRLEEIAPHEPPVRSSTKEARAWRGFAARLARVLAESDPAALHRLQTPYGGLTAAEWLSAREEKQEGR